MKVNCKNWSEGGKGWGRCSLNLYGGRPSFGTCGVCKQREDCPDWTTKDKSRGLGDTIAKITKAVGITPCGGCKQRQPALNKLIPYKDSK